MIKHASEKTKFRRNFVSSRNEHTLFRGNPSSTIYGLVWLGKLIQVHVYIKFIFKIHLVTSLYVIYFNHVQTKIMERKLFRNIIFLEANNNYLGNDFFGTHYRSHPAPHSKPPLPPPNMALANLAAVEFRLVCWYSNIRSSNQVST